MFKPCFKPILHSNLLSNITSTETVIFEVDIIVKTQSVKLYNIIYILRFYFNLIFASKLKQLGYYINSINKCLINKKGYVITFLHLLNNMYSIKNPTLYNSVIATIKLTK